MSELFRMLADIKRDCHPAMVEQMIKLESILDSALQQAHRAGWEQAKRDAYSLSQQHSLLSSTKSGEIEINELAIAIAAMEYGGGR